MTWNPRPEHHAFLDRLATLREVTSVNDVENPGVGGAAMIMRPWCLG
jgi:hypothetical protein